MKDVKGASEMELGEVAVVVGEGADCDGLDMSPGTTVMMIDGCGVLCLEPGKYFLEVCYPDPDCDDFQVRVVGTFDGPLIRGQEVAVVSGRRKIRL